MSCSGALLCAADLANVRSVYVMPMSRGLDQHIASRLASSGVLQVVADPKLADALLTDRISEGFRIQLDEIAPLPKPEAEEAQPKEKGSEESSNPMLAEAKTKAADPGLASTFGRAKGTLFLVDAKSREVVWSTFEVLKNSNPKQLDRAASDIVSRLKRELKSK
jgi:hypothetical protein